MTLIDSRKWVGLFVNETNLGEVWGQGFVPKTNQMTLFTSDVSEYYSVPRIAHWFTSVRSLSLLWQTSMFNNWPVISSMMSTIWATYFYIKTAKSMKFMAQLDGNTQRNRWQLSKYIRHNSMDRNTYLL